jgi:hypothetical protein
LERFRTIIEKPWGEEVQTIEAADHFDKHDPSKNYYYVLETVDGQNYHYLVPYFSNTKYFPAAWIANVMRESATPSHRLRAYNMIFEDELLGGLREPFVEYTQMTREEVQRDETYWQSLRNFISRTLLDYLKTEIEAWESFSLNKLQSLLSGDKFYKLVVETITGKIEEELDLGTASPDQIFQCGMELYMSYFRDIDKIRRGFRNDLLRVYKEHYESLEKQLGGDKIPESKVSMARHQVLKLIGELLKEILEKYINRRSNVYLSIERKSEILQKTLLEK